MTLREIERGYLGANLQYQVVYRYKTYEDGEVIIQSCVLLPAGHPLFGIKKGAKEFRGRFVLPLLMAGRGTYRMSGEDPDSWWLVFADEAHTENGFERLALGDLKGRAVPKIIEELEAVSASSSLARQAVETTEADV